MDIILSLFFLALALVVAFYFDRERYLVELQKKKGR